MTIHRIILILALAMGLASTAIAQESQESVGKWVVNARKSALDGGESVGLIAHSNSGGLIIRCNGKEIDVLFSIAGAYLGKRSQTIAYSVDDGAVQKIPVSPSDDGRAAFVDPGILAAPFIMKDLIGHNKLVYQLTPYQKKAQEVILDIEGLREVISPHIGLCPGLILP